MRAKPYIKNYYYHISTKLQPVNHILSPQLPGKNSNDDEPKIHRICVCPTIAGCICAVGPCITSILCNKKIHIFRTKNKVNGHFPFCPYGHYNVFRTKYPVADAHVTGEKWLLRSTNFKYIGYLNSKEIPAEILECDCGDDDPNVLKEQRQAMKKAHKMLMDGSIRIH